MNAKHLVIEVFEKRSPEMFKDVVKKALELMENAEDEYTKAYAQGMLDISKTLLKIWRFYWPPKVEIEFVFEDITSAERTFKAFRKVFGRTSKNSRNVDDRIYPAVAVDWEDWRTIMIASNGRPSIIDMIVERYLRQKSKKKAYRELAEDLAPIILLHGGEESEGLC